MVEGIKYNKIILFFNTRTDKNLKRQVIMVSTSIHKHTFQSEQVSKFRVCISLFSAVMQHFMWLIIYFTKEIIISSSIWKYISKHGMCNVKNAVLVSSELLPLENVQIKLTTFSQENFLHLCNWTSDISANWSVIKERLRLICFYLLSWQSL